MFTKVLIANRGEIACRIARTLKRMGIGSVAVYSEADAHARHTLECDEAVLIGPAPAANSYLRSEVILEAAIRTGAQAVHPGYGFLSENADFAEACAKAGLAFIGPTPAQMRAFGLKHTARDLAKAEGVPLVPGTDLLADTEAALGAATRIGYPVMLKSTAGGGGIGMRLARDAAELVDAFAAVERLGRSHFKQGGLFLERYVEAARHIEVQVFGDGQGHVLVLGDRDCSAQRRNQKVIEETPAPDLTPELRAELHACAQRLCARVKYASAGTVEFVYDTTARQFYFLEVNTRLQVEHGVTEAVTGVDLVEWMVRQAAGETFLPPTPPAPRGHAIEVRIYAEDPTHDFRPSTGRLTAVSFPAGVRCDTWVEAGCAVSPHYDPLLAKLITHAPDRHSAVTAMRTALDETVLGGMITNVPYLSHVFTQAPFVVGGITTRFLSTLSFKPQAVEVLQPGTQTTVQDFPGRISYWHVGVPPCGPMDAFSFRLANRCLGNASDAAGLEITASGPTLLFHQATHIAITGAALDVVLMASGAEPVVLSMWQACAIPAGATVRFGAIAGPGLRSYVSFAGGLDVPAYLGSRATFTLGGFGGHDGRALRAGDQLPWLEPGLASNSKVTSVLPTVAPEHRPKLGQAYILRVLYGPHGAPDFFTVDDIATLFSVDYSVHFHSNRTGIRLIGPKPTFARIDGGEAGLHPSNIHDNAYAIGAIDFTGDMPILLGPDGPSLGGFVCPATVIQADLWKLGQLRPGDSVRFAPVTVAEARALEADYESLFDSPLVARPAMPRGEGSAPSPAPVIEASASAVAYRLPAQDDRPEVTYRRSGDRNWLIEYGPHTLDIALRFRAHALMLAIEKANLVGLLDLTPGIRSLQVHFDSLQTHPDDLLRDLIDLETTLPPIADMVVSTRTLHLPLSWDDPAIHEVITKYMQVVRADAPWCPSNIEFIRRINGLETIEEVLRTVFEATYLVMGLGDVYLGAPVATPLDPRHRLVTTKYNPARTFTLENVVGIGGAYLCIYGMEGPGGYQLFGRTHQVWNTWKSTSPFEAGKPWLLRFFDQIRFYPVSHEELTRFRANFLHGKAELKIEPSTFRLADYQAFLKEHAESIAAFRAKQQRAFIAERERWQTEGSKSGPDHLAAKNPMDVATLDPIPEQAEGEPIPSPMAGNIWKAQVHQGATVNEGDTLFVIESMKMEFPVTAPRHGRVTAILVKEGQMVQGGQNLLYMA
jgi:urea carboxylase